MRLRVQKFGATPEDRSRLRVEIGVQLPTDTNKPSPVVGNVVSIDDRRARLTGTD